MKAIKYTALLLAITAMVACNKENSTPDPEPEPDPTAVKFTATVSSLFTRSNPVEDAAGTAFKPGDVVAISAGAQGEVKYTLGAGNALTPQADKYLKWDAEALTFNAYYPVGVNNASMTAFDLPADQSTLAKIEQADYMTYTSAKPEAKAATINLALTRKMLRVVITPKFLETRIGSTVEKIEIHSNTNGYKDGAVKSGQITIAPLKHTDGKYYVLLSPTTADAAADFITLTVKKADGNIETFSATSNHVFNAGKSYALDMEVGNNKVNITNITVTDWATGKVIPGGEASEATNANPATHTVHIDKAGELTGELIATAMGAGKDLKITGAMGTADFATLLSWGTKGLTDTDADLLHNLDLTGVTGLTAVPDYAFYTLLPDGHSYVLRSLQRIDLPTTVTSVGKYAFFKCDKLTTVSAPELQTVETNAFFNCFALASFTATKVLTVGEGAFKSCTSLAEVTAPELRTAGKQAFYNCKSLASFTAPALQTLGAEAFVNCAKLASFTAPALQTMGAEAFGSCTTLASFTAPELQTVETAAFAGCEALTTFTAPELRAVENNAFSSCTGLTEFTAPELQTVGEKAFNNCLALTKLSFPKLTYIGKLSFASCLFTELHLTTAGSIDLDPIAFQNFKAYPCTLYLHENKKSGGIGNPKVDADGKTWGGLEWQNIVFVNDDGTIIL